MRKVLSSGFDIINKGFEFDLVHEITHFVRTELESRVRDDVIIKFVDLGGCLDVWLIFEIQYSAPSSCDLGLLVSIAVDEVFRDYSITLDV